ncbi:MAG TPA: DUF5671 domain-containing protein [Pirellulales bacterium]|jgi:hypothetical protein
MDERLATFITHARGKGMDHATIRLLLLSAGWKERQIATAMASEGLELPVPEPAGVGSARDAFLYLLVFTALFVTIVSAIILCFGYLDFLLPDPAWPTLAESAAEEARLPLAATLIAFPLFLYLTIFLQRELTIDPEKRDRPVRKWLTYLTLFLAATTIVSDLITLLYYFLEGELTARLVLKAAVLLLIAGVVFCHYFMSLRPLAEARASRRLEFVLAALAVLLVAASVAEGFALAGSPWVARMRRFDLERSKDLDAIRDVIIEMSTKYADGQRTLVRPLPPTIAEVASFDRTRPRFGRKLRLTDPETYVPYEYRVTGETTFDLCATFDLVRDAERNTFWNHPAGPHCFQFNAVTSDALRQSSPSD